MRRPYSHNAIIARATNGVEYLCHAVDAGVCFVDPAEYLKGHKIVRKISVTLNCSRQELQGYIRGESGKKYSKTQLVLIALNMHWARRLMNGDSERICSEFVAAVLHHFSDYTMPANLDLVTPGDLEDIMKPETVA